MARLRVAVSSRWKDKEGNPQERVDWFTIVSWGRQAELCAEHVKRGYLVYAMGNLRTDTAKDGRVFTELHAERVQWETPKEDRAAASEPVPIADPPPGAEEDTIPFSWVLAIGSSAWLAMHLCMQALSLIA